MRTLQSKVRQPQEQQGLNEVVMHHPPQIFIVSIFLCFYFYCITGQPYQGDHFIKPLGLFYIANETVSICFLLNVVIRYCLIAIFPSAIFNITKLRIN